MKSMYFGRILALCLTATLALGIAPQIHARQQDESSAHPQEPKPPYPYTEESVSYPNPRASGVVIAGTLTKPKGNGPFAAVLLIAGSGPLDRNGSIAGHKPFLVLSDYLTRKGLAVLRVDKRGIGNSIGQFQTATTQDFASDAEAGVRYLMTRSDVDRNHIGLLGHGEGGIVAPMVAAKIPQIGFLVLIGAPGVNGEQVLLQQTERSEKAAHIPEEQIREDRKIGSMLYKMVREGKSAAELSNALNSLDEDDRMFAAHWEPQVRRMDSPWLRWFLSYDPARTLEQVKCPVLAVDGEKDLQLDPERNLNAIRAALARGGNRNVTIQLLPWLNYLLQTAETGLGYEYETIDETISPTALNLIGNWITSHTGTVTK